MTRDQWYSVGVAIAYVPLVVCVVTMELRRRAREKELDALRRIVARHAKVQGARGTRGIQKIQTIEPTDKDN